MKNKYEIRGEITVIFVNHKGKVLETLIDTKDFEEVNSIKGTWCVMKGYTVYRIQKKADTRTIYLHRLIMKPNEDMSVDHINNNPFDNRRSNLRIVTHAQNMQNMSAHKGSQSGIRGVSRLRNKWRARLTVNEKEYYLGVFLDKHEAEKAIKEARRKFMPYSKEALTVPS
jgi:hypothetical protein